MNRTRRLRETRRAIFLVAAVTPWLLTSGFRPRPQGSGPSTWTLERWEAWRDRAIARILAPGAKADGRPILARHQVIARCGEAFAVLAPLLKDPGFLADPGRAKALGHFVKFIAAEHRLELADSSGNLTHGLGMDVDDAGYWTYVSPYVTFPQLLRSQEFLEELSNPGSYQAAVNAIEEQNRSLPEERKWTVYPYRSQFILSVDETTYGRLLILVPNEPLPDGRRLDRWIQFALPSPGQRPLPKTASVSVIGVVHGALPSDSTQAYLSDFMREKDPGSGETVIKPNFLMKPDPSKVCIDCHKTAVIPIHPGAAFGFGEGGNLMEKPSDESIPSRLNRLIEQYGKSDFGQVDPDSYGPSLGVAQPVSDAFIEEATADHPLPKSSYDAVRDAMSCARCHDRFGKINYLPAVQTDRDAKAFLSKKGLVQTYVESGWMPPHNTLNAEERFALWRCVMKAYFDPETENGSFVEWLKGN